jgi:hypothetical protein
VLSVRSLPRHPEFMKRYFNEGENPLDINDVWPENYSANSAQKVWGVKYAARHPNIALLDLSSFKCGHDAPTYGLVDSIVNAGQVPYAAQHDLDANKPGGSIKIRVKTYSHSLKLHTEALEDAAEKMDEFHYNIDLKRLELLKLKERQLESRKQSDPNLARAIAELAKKTGAYQAPERAPEPPKTGLVSLKKKTAEGAIVAIDAAE